MKSKDVKTWSPHTIRATPKQTPINTPTSAFRYSALAGALLLGPALLPQSMLLSSAALAACNNTGLYYHATNGSACTYNTSTPGTYQSTIEGEIYTVYSSNGAQTAVLLVRDDDTTMSAEGNTIIENLSGQRHAISVERGGSLTVDGNLHAHSHSGTNSRALYIGRGTVSVNGDLVTYRHGAGTGASMQVESDGVLTVEGEALIFANGNPNQSFRQAGTSTFKKNLHVVYETPSPTALGGQIALRQRGGTLDVAESLRIDAEDSNGIRQEVADSSITAQSLYITTTTNKSGALSSIESADGYRIALGKGAVAGTSIIDAQGRGIVFAGQTGEINLGMGTNPISAEPGVATLALGADASVKSAQTAIVFGDAATQSYTLLDSGVEVAGDNGLYTDGAGDATLELNEGALLSGAVVMGDGSDTLIINGAVDLSQVPTLDGGDDLSGADGFIDTAVLNLSGEFEGGKLLNWEKVIIDGTSLAFSDKQLSTGTEDGLGLFISNGGTLLANTTFDLTGSMNVDAGSQFVGQGNGSGIYNLSGNLVNAGTVNLQNTAPGDIVHVQGNYVGNDGTLQLDTVLGDDSSATDRLIVEGDTSGSSQLAINNTGGAGAETLADGIQVVQVNGLSNGSFNLLGDYDQGGQPAIVAGAYAYKLYQGGVSDPADGSWYLRSQLDDSSEDPDPEAPDPGQPEPPVEPGPGTPTPPTKPLYQAGVPVYEAYPQILLGLNTLPTLQQRVGNRSWGSGTQVDNTALTAGAASSTIEQNGVWGRVEGSHTRMSPRRSTSNAQYEVDTVKMQLGFDGLLHKNESGKWLAGIQANYVHGSADIWSPHDSDGGKGKIKTDGVGFGTTLTWYGHSGAYVDGQAQAMWYDSKLYSDGGKRSLAPKNEGFGYAFSVETGKRTALNQNWSLTPQAQLTYSNVSFKDFTDTFGADVKLESADSLQARLGLAIERQSNDYGVNNKTSRSHVYGIVNLYYDFLNGTKVKVANTQFTNRNDELFAGIGVGGSYNWNKDKYSLYGEASVNTGLSNFGDSRSYKGIVGLRIRW